MPMSLALSIMLDGSHNAGQKRMLVGHAKLNISTAYPRTLGILLVHDFC